MWVARDERGELNMFTDKPIRCKKSSAPWFDTNGKKRETCIIYDGSKKCRRYALSRDRYPHITFENSPKELVIKDDLIEFACDLFGEIIINAIDINKSDSEFTKKFRKELEDYVGCKRRKRVIETLY